MNRNTAGLFDDLKSGTQSLLTGGGPGSADYEARVQLFADSGDRALQQFSTSPEGQAVVSKLAFEIAIPAFIVGLAAGWFFGARGRK